MQIHRCEQINLSADKIVRRVSSTVIWAIKWHIIGASHWLPISLFDNSACYTFYKHLFDFYSPSYKNLWFEFLFVPFAFECYALLQLCEQLADFLLKVAKIFSVHQYSIQLNFNIPLAPSIPVLHLVINLEINIHIVLYKYICMYIYPDNSNY